MTEQICRASSMAEQPRPVDDGGSTPTARLLKSEWEVRACHLDLAQSLVRRWHYSAGGSNTAVYTFGLWRRDAWMDHDATAVSWFLPPTKSAALSIDPNWNGVLALSRIVAKPGAPKNTCSFLIRHSMRMLDRTRWPVLVSYADEWQEHTGAIYLACGWTFDGYTKPERTYVKNGRMVSRKRGPRTFTHSEMLANGCECLGKFRRKRFVHRTQPPGATHV
jgi:hypothetical protein